VTLYLFVCIQHMSEGNKLCKLKCASLHNVPAELHSLVFGPSPQSKRPSTSSAALKQAAASLRWTELALQDTWMHESLSCLGNVNMNYLREALLQFHQQRGDEADCTDFVHYQTLMYTAFTNHSADILQWLGTSKYAQQSFLRAIPSMQTAASRARKMSSVIDTTAMDLQERKLQLHHALVALDVDDQYLDRCLPLQERLSRFDVLPDHEAYSPASTAEKIHLFLKTQHQKERRTDMLRREFLEWDRQYRDNSSWARDFLCGAKDVDAEEVVAMTSVADKCRAMAADREHLHHYESCARNAHLLQGVPWQVAVCDVLADL
jgi:hypothetical protein